MLGELLKKRHEMGKIIIKFFLVTEDRTNQALLPISYGKVEDCVGSLAQLGIAMVMKSVADGVESADESLVPHSSANEIGNF